MVPRSSVKSPSRAQITLPKVSVKYAKISQNIRQISRNRSPNFVPDRVLQLVVELEQREVAVAVQLLRRAVVLRYRLRSRSFLAKAPTPDATGGGCAYLVHMHPPALGLRRAVGGVQQLLPEHRLHHAEHRRVRRHVVPRGG